MEKLLSLGIFILLPFMLLSQNIGDYRSNVTAGNWNTLSSWQYYNGTGWIAPSGVSPQGYPGQYIGNGSITIANGHIITINSNTPNNFGALVIGEGVSGTLVVGADIDMKTLSVSINPGAILTFEKNVEIRFPLNTSLVINSPGKIDTTTNCSNNNAIYIGTVKFAVCTGSGNTYLTFTQLNSLGGSINAVPSSNSPVCKGSTIDLVGNYSGAIGKTTSGGSITGVNYSWSIKAPDNSVSTINTQNPSFLATQSGSYLATLSCSTYYDNDLFLNSKTISVIVNTLPVITTQPVNELDCEGSLVNFKIITSGSGLNYTWQRKKPADATFFTIPVGETNTTYPTPNEVSLANVGSAQYPNGTQFQVLVSNGMCSITSNVVTLSVNEIKSINSPALNPTQSVNDVTLCSGSNYSYTAIISNPSNGPVSYQWKSQVPSGSWNNVVDGTHFSGATNATLSIINGTPTESGKYRVDIIYNRTGGNCSVSSFSKVRLLTFLPLLTTPQTTMSQPDCTLATGSITVTVQNSGDTYSFDNGTNYQPGNIKFGLTPGTYKVLVKNIKGCVSIAANCVITTPVAAIWDGITSTWSNGPPTILQSIIFNGTYNSLGNLEGCSCQVNSGSVTFNSGHTLKITNGVTVSGGSLTFEDKASLVQTNDLAVNYGNINYKRLSPPIINTDYVYWSSPVLGFTLGGVSPKTLSGKMYSYNAFANPENWMQESSGTVMSPAKGYIIRGPEYATPAPPFPSGILATFVGIPNNGEISIPIGGVKTSNLIGNPYPSALDADLFLSKNNSVLDGTIYFWTHSTAIQLASNITDGSAGSGTYAYTSNDYTAYNSSGGVGIGTGNFVNGVEMATNKPTGKIGAGQSFFTTSKASGQVARFNNSMRLDKDGVKLLDNSQFFKNASNSKIAEAIQKNRIWLNLTNVKGAFKQTLVGYISNATNDYDDLFDGESFDGNEFIDFYSVNQGKKLVIQGRALPFEESDTIPLGYRSAISGDFTISIDEVDGLFIDKAVYLKDNKYNSVHNLNESAYDFNTEKGIFDNRFVLSYANKTLEIDNFNSVEKGVLISNKNKELKINSSVENIDMVLIYDLLGRQIYKKTNVDSKELIILNLLSVKQTIVVKVSLQGGKIFNKKIIY